MKKVPMKKRLAAIALLGMAGGLLSVQPALAADITVYKSPTCGCCSKWIKHLEANGFTVEAHDRNDMPKVKRMFGVQPQYQSCHTAIVDGYLIEGHVPAGDIHRLLDSKPTAVKALAVPGMPMGSPGMEGHRSDRYEVLSINADGEANVFSRY
jgi:hypothetical protein